MSGVCFAAGRRTALGDFGGALKEIPLTDLAAHAARACIEASGVAPERFDHMVFTTTVPTDRDTLFAAGGAECYSRVPHAVSGARWGLGRGPKPLEDVLDRAYRCPFSLEYMGETAEILAEARSRA